MSLLVNGKSSVDGAEVPLRVSSDGTLETAFAPSGNTVNLVVTGTAQNLTLTAGTGTIRVANIGTQTVFIAFSGTASASTSIPLLPNTVETFAKGSVATLSAIAASTGSTIYVTTGVGV